MQLKMYSGLNGVNARTKPNVAIVTYPFLMGTGNIILDNLVALTRPLVNRLMILTGGNYDSKPRGVEVIRISEKQRTSFVTKVLEQMIVHIRLLRFLSRMSGEIDIIIFSLGIAYPVPLFFAKAAHVKSFVVLNGGGAAKRLPATRENRTSWQLGELATIYLLEFFERISYYVADKLIAVSPSVIDQMNLHRYAKKTAIADLYILDCNVFGIKTNIGERQDIVGYVGRLEAEKGVLNFIKAIPKILCELPHLRFVVIGEGYLQDKIERSLISNNLTEYVQLIGWVPHDDIPAWLNKMKLLVIPSYTETGPIIMVESMACGTPVLATPVGSVPDHIEDGRTGFLLENNAPGCIARNVVRAISCNNLAQISKNEYAYVCEKYTRTKASEAWSEILSNGSSG
jgi:glycosyltransferase involved in cell wall biosynthesis